MTHAQSAIRIETLTYKHDAVECQGTLVYDGASSGRRPGVLVAPTFWGLDAGARRKSVQLARLGYAVLALDLYGEGRVAADRDEAARLMQGLAADPQFLRARALAGLKALRYQRLVDGARLGAVGYCFGGQVVLELARAGAELRGVVAFHGLLAALGSTPAAALTAKVLVLHGADDPLVPPAEAEAFRAEMRAAQADWQMVYYGGAVHGFTNPDAGADPKTGIAYDEPADQRSWQAMKSFFEENLG